MKTVEQHIKDKSFRADRHLAKLSNSSSFQHLTELPPYKGLLLKLDGKKFYKAYGEMLVEENLLSVVDLPMLEAIAETYQELKSAKKLCKNDMSKYLFENKISTGSAFVSYYKTQKNTFIDLMKAFGATPKEREKINKAIEEGGDEEDNPFSGLGIIK